MSWNIIFALLFSCTLVQRIYELVVSARNQKQMRAQGFTRHDGRLVYSVMFLVHGSWFFVMVLEHYYYPSQINSLLLVVFLLAFLVAELLRFWTLRTLGSQWNVNVMSPLVSEPALLPVVTEGPYRYIRHPNYLALMIEIAALPLLGNAPGTAIIWTLFNAAVLSLRIPQEEFFLAQRPGYSEAMKAKPRFIPLAVRMDGQIV